MDTYVATLRCQTWNTWPERVVIQTSSLVLTHGTAALPTKLAVLSYLPRSVETNYNQEKSDLGPLIWTGRVPGLYTVQDSILKAPEDIVEIAFEHRHADRGEVDISIAFPYTGEVPDDLFEAVRCSLFAVMSVLNLQLPDFLTPAAPPQLRRVKDGGDTFDSDIRVAVRNRKVLSEDNVRVIIDNAVPRLSSPNGEKLRTALELHGSHFFERANRTRFLLLVIALETLAVPTLKHGVALALIDKWRQDVVAEQAQYAKESDEYAALEALSRELLFRRESSIRAQMRALVQTVAPAKGGDASPVEKRALWVYDARSTLVHDGSLPPGDLEKAENAAREVLEYVFHALLK
jgi:hypothetical protein